MSSIGEKWNHFFMIIEQQRRKMMRPWTTSSVFFNEGNHFFSIFLRETESNHVNFFRCWLNNDQMENDNESQIHAYKRIRKKRKKSRIDCHMTLKAIQANGHVRQFPPTEKDWKKKTTKLKSLSTKSRLTALEKFDAENQSKCFRFAFQCNRRHTGTRAFIDNSITEKVVSKWSVDSR